MHPRGIRMNFDWSGYLNLAQELAGQTGTSASKEAKLRSSISRAYHAAFCNRVVTDGSNGFKVSMAGYIYIKVVITPITYSVE